MVAALLAVFLGFGVVFAGTAHAAEDVNTTEKLNADQMKRLAGLPEDQRNGIRDRLNGELGKTACSDGWFFAAMGGSDCENVAAKAFGTFLTTPEKSLGYSDDKNTVPFCAGLASVGAPPTATTWCAGGAAFQKFAPLAGVVLRTALSMTPGGQVVLGTVDTVAFIANAKDGFEKFANSVKDEGVKATNEVLNNLMKVSSFEVDDSFRDLWAIFAGVGIVIMGLMYFKLFKDVSNEEIDLDTARQSLFWYGPLSMVLVLFGPAIGYVINGWLTQVTESFTPWTSNQIMDFATAISRFAGYESNGVFGPLAAVLLFGLLFVGAWALLGLFALQPFALYLLGVGLALMIGFMIHPQYRERVSKTGTLWLGIALSKPLILLLMGALFSFISSRPAFQGVGTDDALINASSVFLAAAAMLVLAFSPALLFKFVPLLPSSATSYGANRPSIAGAAMVAGTGAAVGSMIRNRRISQNQSGSGGAGAAGGAARGAARAGGAAMSGVGPGGGSQGSGVGQPTSRAMARQGSGGQGSGGESGPDTRTLGEMQSDDRAATPSGKAAQAVRGGAAAMGRGSGTAARGSAKIAAGGATAFLLAGREGARQAALRGRQGVNAMAPDTDHISGR
ncbi:hypothetical protein [Arthrobacter sp. MP_2.3]|uniref:hypothetical protein n=1 Tax=Arthrobacter sp. MP_2.3 TaxID=3349633 RepID=UPI0038D40B64